MEEINEEKINEEENLQNETPQEEIQEAWRKVFRIGEIT